IGLTVSRRTSAPSVVVPGVGSRLTALTLDSAEPELAQALPAQPEAVAAGGGSLWLADPRDQVLLRADATTGAIVDRVPLAGEPGGVGRAAGSGWAEAKA